jgi:photosystem II stability/assembly factor-like uncharacterized protein
MRKIDFSIFNDHFFSVRTLSAKGCRFSAEMSAFSRDRLYTSSDYGSIWVKTTAPTEYWYSVASSSSGQYLVAVCNGGPIYTSSNYGSDWTETTAPSDENWWSVASSSSGQFLVAVAAIQGVIYTSSDNGSSWVQASAPTEYWYSV